MKHLKTYEQSQVYKYHLVIKANSGNNLFILSMINDNLDGYYGILTYTMHNTDTNGPTKYNLHASEYNKATVDEGTLLKSESINECLEFCKLYFKADKYNL